MKNVKLSVEKDVLVITIDLTKDFGLSNSGKTTIVASTNGFTQIGNNGIKLNLNCIK